MHHKEQVSYPAEQLIKAEGTTGCWQVRTALPQQNQFCWQRAVLIGREKGNIPSEPGAAAVWGGVGVGGGSNLALPPGWRAAVKPLVPSGPRAILTAWVALALALP